MDAHMASSSYCATSKHPKKGITMKLAMIGLLAAGLASTATAAIELTLDNPRGFRSPAYFKQNSSVPPNIDSTRWCPKDTPLS